MYFIIFLYSILWTVCTFAGGMVTTIYTFARKEKDKQGNFLFTLLLLEFWGAYIYFFKDYKFINSVLVAIVVALLLGILWGRKMYK